MNPTLLPGPKQQSDLLDELSAVRLSSAELGVLCRLTGPGGALNTQPERIMRAGVQGPGCIYMRGRAVYREELLSAPLPQQAVVLTDGMLGAHLMQVCGGKHEAGEFKCEHPTADTDNIFTTESKPTVSTLTPE